MTKAQDQLPIQVPGTKAAQRGGPVYQGVGKQIRALFPKDDEEAASRKVRLAGTIAQAMSLAASIDRVSGYVPKGAIAGGYQAAGMQLAAMHERLDALLERLDPEGLVVKDPFTAWAEELDKEFPEVGTDGRAEAPHPPL
jgi:hypothetical protein